MKSKIRSVAQKLGLYEWIVKLLNARQIRSNRQQEKKNADQRLIFYSSFLKQGDLVYDVGANVGNRVRSFLQIGCKVIAVEPQDECVHILQKEFGNSIEIIKKGLGSKEEEKTMYVANESTISSLSEQFIERLKKDRFKRYNWDRQIKIQLTTLDKLISQHGKPLFCKIDVEGYEYEVLKGLSQPLKYISIEYAVPEQTDILIDCINYCTQLNPNYKFNYCVGESMQYLLQKPMNATDFLQHVQTAQFQETEFGDVYIME
jgi:FkbM family methyltransferase